MHRYGPEQPAQILAVHGLTGHGMRWRTLATRHLSGFSVVRADLLGHGRSSWEAPWTLDANVAALADVLSREATRAVVVVGHSFGGAIALKLAVARPDLVASLVLLDPAVGLDGAWMANIADDMMASPYYLDRDEARNEKASGSWAAVGERRADQRPIGDALRSGNGNDGIDRVQQRRDSMWWPLAQPLNGRAIATGHQTTAVQTRLLPRRRARWPHRGCPRRCAPLRSWRC